MTEDKGHWDDEFLVRLDAEGTVVEDLREHRRWTIDEWREQNKQRNKQRTCQDCKWWIEQGPRTKDIDFQPTVIGWCKRMPRTETDKDKDDWCGEFQPR